ncbi:hypothetical protein ACI1S7_11120, partial [Lactococcus petauri]
ETETINTSITLYQEVYGGDKAAGISRKLKVAGGFAAGLGLSVVGGGLAADASANTVTPSLEKKLTKDILATQESTAIELTESTSTTEEGSTSDRPSESQSDSESATERQSEAESRADVGTMASHGWVGNTLSVTLQPGDLRRGSSGGSDYSKASAQLTIVLNNNGTVRVSGTITNVVTEYGASQFGFTLADSTRFYFNGAGTAVSGGRASFSTDFSLATLSNFANKSLGKNTIFRINDVSGNGGGGWDWYSPEMAMDLSPILQFSTSLSTSTSQSTSTSTSTSLSTSNSTSQSRITSTSTSVSLSTSDSVSLSLSNSDSRSSSESRSTSDSLSLSQSVSDSHLESRAASISASLSGSTSASAFLSHLASQSQSASHLESFLESI